MASLTKSQLINELINHGVTPPSPGVKKEKLVQMYEKHVAHHQEAAGEFSSDDEGAVRQQNGDEGSVSSLATDVSELNNEELAEHLRSHGVNVGPIVGSTRRLYEKKLSKLLGEAVGSGGGAQHTTTTRYSTRTVTTVVNGSGGGDAAAEDEYSDSDPEPERQPEPEPEVRKRRAADTTTSGYSYSYKSSRASAAAPASSGSSQLKPRSPAVRAVFLRDEADQPSPRRGVHDVRGSYPREQYLLTKTTTADSYTSADLTASRAAPLASQKSVTPSGCGGWLRALVKLCVLLLLIAAAYYCYQHYSEAPSFEELQKAARDAVRRAAEKVDGLRQAAAGQQDAKQT